MDRNVLRDIDKELDLCDLLLAHAVERRYELSSMIVSPECEYKRSKFVARLDEEITDYSRRADMLVAEREGLLAD